jgi:membrane protein
MLRLEASPMQSSAGTPRSDRRLPKQPQQRWLRWGRRWLRPLWAASRLWLRADCVDLSAAFAYHTLQSFLPALLIALSLLSRFLGGDDELLLRIHDLVGQVLPSASMPLFERTLERFTRQGLGAGLVGAGLLVLNANNIYLTLQRGADRLWWNRPFDLPPLRWDELLHRFAMLRLKAFALLLLASLLLVADQLVSHLRLFGFRVLRQWLVAALPDSLHWLVNVSASVDLLISLLIGCVIAVLILWQLPSRPVPCRPLLVPSILVGVSITLLNLLLARILVALGIRFQAYGVVGGVLLLTLWVWLVGVILYYGQCLAVVLARARSAALFHAHCIALQQLPE